MPIQGQEKVSKHSKPPSQMKQWFQQWTKSKIEPAEGESRTIQIGGGHQEDNIKSAHRGSFVSACSVTSSQPLASKRALVPNKVHTARYTWWSFIPKNLFEQFRSLANVYFIIIVILQFLPPFTQPNTSPFVAAIPLFLIVVFTAIKDGIEDWRRHSADNAVNNHPCWKLFGSDSPCAHPKAFKLSNIIPNFDSRCSVQSVKSKLDASDYLDFDGMKLEDIKKGLHRESIVSVNSRPVWKKTAWKTIMEGDVMLLRNNEPIPADILIISTSEDKCQCYVETKNLDGETNLKVKSAIRELAHIKTPSDCATLHGTVDIEEPSPNMATMNGKGRIVAQGELFEFPVTMNQILLRGCVIRNTKWVIGIVLVAGPETKLMLNSGAAPSKQSKIDRTMRPQIFINLVILATICLLCFIMSYLYIGGFKFAIKKADSEPVDDRYYFEMGYFFYPENMFAQGIPNLNLFEPAVILVNCLIMFQNIVPIAIFISADIAKLIQSWFISQDVEMIDPETNLEVMVRTRNLTDDLGQIEYIFSDKTGTLTSNEMIFRKCSINGVVYGDSYISEAFVGSSIQSAASPEEERIKLQAKMKQREQDQLEMRKMMKSLFDTKYLTRNGPLPFVDLNLHQHIVDGLDIANDSYSDYSMPGATDVANQATAIIEFFTLLAVCHTVLIENPEKVEKECDILNNPEDDEAVDVSDKSEELIVYKAQSPDEAALVSAAKDVGFTFLKRNDNTLTVDIMGNKKKFEILQVIEFNSDRKRMSVIVKKEDDEQVILLCKGADSVIFERLSPQTDENLLRLTTEHLETFANDGLRTLCLAYKLIPMTEYKEWEAKYRQAQCLIDNREERMAELASDMEMNMNLMGATAIEDKLQSGVPESIELLAKAGIKIWVLTGDKMETAINIGYASNLLTRKMVLIIIKSANSVQNVNKQITDALRMFWGASSRKESMALVIDGESLTYGLRNGSKHFLLELARRCKVVICCRVSPLQKAEVVSLVRKGLAAMCLAIGDGANDKADIGIGIRGKEGLQAVMASDYAIGQFRFLTRLLLVHGRWSYIRIAELILNYFYKNVVFLFILFWFQYDSGFSAAVIMDVWYGMLFNIFLSLFPNMMPGIFDQDVNDTVSLKVPQLYQVGIQQQLFNAERFWIYIGDAIYQSVICYYSAILIFEGSGFDKTGIELSQGVMGNVLALFCIVTVDVYMSFDNHSWNIFTHFCLWLSICATFGFGYLNDVCLFGLLTQDCPPTIKGGVLDLYQNINFYLSLVMVLALCLIPRLIYKYIQQTFFPTDTDIVREFQKYVWKQGDPIDLTLPDALPKGSSIRKKKTIKERLREKQFGTLDTTTESDRDTTSASEELSLHEACEGTVPSMARRNKGKKRVSLADAPINPGGVAFETPSLGRRPFTIHEEDSETAPSDVPQAGPSLRPGLSKRQRGSSIGEKSVFSEFSKKTSQFIRSLPHKLKMKRVKKRPLVYMDSHKETINTGFAFSHEEGMKDIITSNQ